MQPFVHAMGISMTNNDEDKEHTLNASQAIIDASHDLTTAQNALDQAENLPAPRQAKPSSWPSAPCRQPSPKLDCHFKTLVLHIDWQALQTAIKQHVDPWSLHYKQGYLTRLFKTTGLYALAAYIGNSLWHYLWQWAIVAFYHPAPWVIALNTVAVAIGLVGIYLYARNILDDACASMNDYITNQLLSLQAHRSPVRQQSWIWFSFQFFSSWRFDLATSCHSHTATPSAMPYRPTQPKAEQRPEINNSTPSSLDQVIIPGHNLYDSTELIA